MKMFDFNPADSAEAYRKTGYVHIPNGLTGPYLQSLVAAAEENLKAEKLMKQFAIGDKQQAMYQFPTDNGYDQLLDMVAKVSGLNRADLVLSERHFKAYDLTAIPDPPPHKDRFASEVSVGFSVTVPKGSTLVLYPQDYLAINSFNSSSELNASFAADYKPAQFLKTAKRVEINDTPGDIVVFKGNKIWHLRARPAGTTMLYLKLNTYNCDVLGEDRNTAPHRELTQQLLMRSDAELENLVPLIGRKVDYFHRRLDRHFNETLGAVLFGDKHFTIDELELRALKLADGRRSIIEIAREIGEGVVTARVVTGMRRLATRGIVDLHPAHAAASPLAASAAAVTV